MGHDTKTRLLRRASAGALLSVLMAGGVQAQTFSTNSAEFNGGYGRGPGTENLPIDVDTRDANGNRLIVDGLVQEADEDGTFSRKNGRGAAYGSGPGATAIGNNLVVVTQGNWNTVIVNSTQTNNGNVTANSQGSVINGELDLND